MDFIIPLHYFIVEGCIPELNKSRVSPTNDEKLRFSHFTLLPSPEILKVGSKA